MMEDVPALVESVVKQLEGELRGKIVRPGSKGYDKVIHSVWNKEVTERPQAIVRVAGVADVIATVKAVAPHAGRLPFCIKAGGHGRRCLVDDGIVIDLRKMNGVKVDPYKRQVVVEAGALLGDVDHEASAHGLVVPAGVISHTGVAGLTLGGGIGWLCRTFGLTVDSVLSIDIVTSNGEFLTANNELNQELFWGARGAGLYLGVITSFTFQAYPLKTVYSGPIFFPWPRFPEVSKEWLALINTPGRLIDNCTVYFNCSHTPDGNKMCGVLVCYVGSESEAQSVVKPFLDLGPVMTMLQERPMKVWNSMNNHLAPHGRSYYQKGMSVRKLDQEMMDTIGAHFASFNLPTAIVMLEPLGGKILEKEEDYCAVGGRKSFATVVGTGGWEKPEDGPATIEWSRGLWNKLSDFMAEGGQYQNYYGTTAEEEEKRGADTYFAGNNLSRIASLKTKYDPINLFPVFDIKKGASHL